SGNKVLLTAKTKSSKKLSISVEDEGIGIPQKDIEKLTERFFRVDHSRNNLSGGHGLGLTIVNHILAKNEYFLEISSKLGEGSIFKFDLDLS
ncbi:ATP-binding protein, partial [Alphaproteobacteria bacterium]|nr:ATP-binding protein [Alphaproteobacteria bacterium]